ncbi:YqcI/YcgG family protein, partial [Helicobacter sp. MIT 14-3879]|uniref:YqcI/YcgG family protein n=1 Tax=Helicobacter sp. MIT 14-3879 TaxID=2040649 RepID=UPI000E368F7A
KKQGVSVREIIRNRVKKYNNGYLPQSLGFFGSKDNFEWKQYALDENYLHTKQETFSQCPLKIFKRNPNV